MKAVKYLKLCTLYFLIIIVIAIGQRHIERVRFFDYMGSYKISDCFVTYLQDYARRYFADGTALSDYVFRNASLNKHFSNVGAVQTFKDFEPLTYCDENGYVKGYFEPLVDNGEWSVQNGYLLFDFTKIRLMKWMRPYALKDFPVYVGGDVTSNANDFGRYGDSVTKEPVEHEVIADDGHGGYVLQPDTFVKGSHEFKIF